MAMRAALDILTSMNAHYPHLHGLNIQTHLFFHFFNSYNTISLGLAFMLSWSGIVLCSAGLLTSRSFFV